MTIPGLRFIRARWDILLAVALVGLSFVPGVARQGLELAGLPDRPLDLLGIALLVVQGGAVALIRWRAGWALAVTGAAFAAYQLLGYPTTFAALGLLVTLVAAGALIEQHRRLTAVIALSAYVALAAALLAFDVHLTIVDTLTFGMLLAALWIWGSWLRSQAAARRAREVAAERDAIAAERSRIARELHDVVTHHVTAMVVQAEAGGYQPNLDAGTQAVLASIADGGRATLVDLRSLLGALEAGSSDSRAPMLQTPDEIVAGARAAGQSIRLRTHGEPRRLQGAAGLAVVRVIQESITNARRYATDGAATVDVTHDEHAILVEVVSSGTGPEPTSTAGGRGIVGMRERVESLGGDLQAAAQGDAFVVRARIPL
ncbi:sensor histidine kinase [Microbacterium sp. NPDC089987]|uniref:sensor histidine kinase n=1 Tax=Microbacterium sp. NPDC089987 TaxID=3364202 RepID=UPI00381AE8D4